MSWQHPAQMTYQEVFTEMQRQGYEWAQVRYNGAHDESFVETAQLFKTKPEPTDMAMWKEYDEAETEGAEYRSPLDERDWLGVALMQPIITKLGQSFGDSVDGVDGVCVWDATTERVYIEHTFLEWEEEHIHVSGSIA